MKRVIEFIKSLYPDRPFIGLHEPHFAGNEKKYLTECIDSTFVSSVGKFVDRFEQMTAEYTGAESAVVCVNGTNALFLALKLVGVEQNDEVITQALTFIATANAITYTGAIPVFLDVDRDTMGLSPEAVEKWLSKNAERTETGTFNKKTGRRIKACVPMHTFGHPVHIDRLKDVCEKWRLELVEDAAESLGSYYKGIHTGTFGRVGVISYNGNKTITTGGGGMLLFQDKDLGRYAKHLTTQAKLPHRWEFAHDQIGYNFRMPNINAALGCAQMEELDVFLENKRKTAQAYKEFFQTIEEIDFFEEPQDCRSNYWLNAVLLKNKTEQQHFLEQTNDNGVMTRPIWKLMNKLPMFADCQTDELTHTLWFEERIVNIPSSVRL